jgi:hypothetical protein
MRLCEMVWTPERAAMVSAQIESATGLPCPCKRGLACPFVPVSGADLASPQSDAEREQRVEVRAG